MFDNHFMSNDKIQEWIINWFIDNTDAKPDTVKSNLSANYLGIGWIDSFRFIAFITEIEDHFKIKFSNDEFQNRNFGTIKGISEILRKKENVKI